MLEHLKNEFNKTTTANNDKAYKSTKSNLLDFFSSAGAMRKSTEEEIIRRFVLAFNENSELALKALFYFRDIRGGQGERRLFREIINYLGDNHSDRLEKLIPLIPEYGRWDDLLVLLNTRVEGAVIALIKEKIEKDINSPTPTLLGKWLPSENTSSKNTVIHAKYLRKKLGMSSKQYRQTLSKLRTKINIVEKNMSSKEWSIIKYDKLPSKAGMLYRKAFLKHDQERYEAFINKVKKGEAKINSGTLYPYEIYDKVMGSGKVDETLEEMWKALPNYVKEDENALVMADVSGSMWGTPISVSVSLALYFAERNKGAFANHFMTFSGNPELVEIKGSNVYEKMRFIQNSNWGMNTDLLKAFRKILFTAIDNDVPKNELPQKLYIISDMQFDQATGSGWGYHQSAPQKSTFERTKAEFEEAGYELPEVVFWNVNDYNNKPVTTNDVGVQLVSGFSPVLFKQITSGLSAYDLMVEILSSERYNPVV